MARRVSSLKKTSCIAWSTEYSISVTTFGKKRFDSLVGTKQIPARVSTHVSSLMSLAHAPRKSGASTDIPFITEFVDNRQWSLAMFEKSRLPDSLEWRDIGWIEMELSQADAVNRLNMSRSVVHPRTRSISVPQLVANYSVASGRRISASSVRRRLHNSGLYARRQLYVYRSTYDREGPSYLGQENTFPGPDRDGLYRRVHFTLESDSGRLLIWRERSARYHQSNTVERHSYRGGGIMVWAEISLGGYTGLHVFHGGTLIDVRYRDEILDPCVHQYASTIGIDFSLMDDNARPYRNVIVEEYLEGLGLERIEWPAQSPDLNQIENHFDYLGIQVAALSPPPRSLGELEQSLLRVWSSLPVSVTNNLTDSMEIQCRQCIQARGRHIPY
ncbi:transposable element Tcb2 transposase [Trichonephila clavipes]|nr:transposable element Tcb2 transposase [Trichonephila clavipes]